MALIQYTGLNVLSCGTPKGDFIRILPGINEIDDKDLQSILQLPSIIARQTKGVLKIISQGKKEKESQEDILDMIPKIFDKKLLNKLIKTDTRPQVIDAAKAQLDLIQAKKEVKEVENDEQPQHFN